MLESAGLQQIFSMSSAVEKVHHVQQQQTDVQASHTTAQLSEQSEQKKTEVQQFDKLDEAMIREERKEGKQKHSEKEDRNKEDTEELHVETEEKEHHTLNISEIEQGKIIDVVV